MPADMLATRREVYALIEAAQDVVHLDVRPRLVALTARAEAGGQADLVQLARGATVFYDLLHGENDPESAAAACEDLVSAAERLGAPGALAFALCLRAMHASNSVDKESLLSDAGGAIALTQRDDADPDDRCFVWTGLSCIYLTLNLWELADELNDLAAELAPRCSESELQLAAVSFNRFLIRLAWSAALFEHGDEADALHHLGEAQVAASNALLTIKTPELWRHGALATRDLLTFVRHAFGSTPQGGDPEGAFNRLERHRDILNASQDVEVLPYMDGFMALGLLQLGRVQEARSLTADRPDHATIAAADGFQAWVRAQVLTPPGPDEATVAQRDYAKLICDLRWTARAGVLAAARTRIDEARLAAEHAVLSREVMSDALTGLQNRRRFDAWLTGAGLGDRPVALLLIDVDDFKQVNDTHGHGIGDEVLRQIANAVTENIRENDIGIRIGGDEFAVVLTAADRLTEDPRAEQVLDSAARHRARAIAATVADAPWAQLSAGLSVTVTVGLATGWVGEHYPGGPHALYRVADEDLYATKRRRRPAHVGA